MWTLFNIDWSPWVVWDLWKNVKNVPASKKVEADSVKAWKFSWWSRESGVLRVMWLAQWLTARNQGRAQFSSSRCAHGIAGHLLLPMTDHPRGGKIDYLPLRLSAPARALIDKTRLSPCSAVDSLYGFSLSNEDHVATPLSPTPCSLLPASYFAAHLLNTVRA